MNSLLLEDVGAEDDCDISVDDDGCGDGDCGSKSSWWAAGV